MKNILQLKHWQVFIILMIGYVLNFVLLRFEFSVGSISSLMIAVFFGIMTLILFFSWVLSIGLFFNSLPKNSYRFRKVVLIFAILSCTFGYSELQLSRLAIDNIMVPEWITLSMGPLTIFGVFYTFYKVPKSLRSVELGRKASFKECIVDALLLFAFPIGVWFIQPKVNLYYSLNKADVDKAGKSN